MPVSNQRHPACKAGGRGSDRFWGSGFAGGYLSLGQKRVKWWAADLTTPCPTHLPILRFGWGLPTSRGRSRPNGGTRSNGRISPSAPFWLMPLKGARHRLENLAAAIEGGRLPADLQAEARQAIASGRSKPHAAPLAAPQR
jgi:hypothetical protein